MRPASDPVSLRRRVYPILIAVAAGALGGRILGVTRLSDPGMNRFDPVRTAGAVVGPLASPDPLGAAVATAAGQDTWKQADLDDRLGLWSRSRPEPVPTLGGNERSRWDTIRALVENGTYVIGYRDLDPTTAAFHDRGITFEDGWQTVDKVLHPEVRDNTQRFFSSKPPLLPTLLAGEYWVLRKAFGWSLTDPQGRWYVVRTILLTVNWLPFVIYLVLLSRLVERFGTTDWGRFFVLAAGCFATFVTTFSVSINNHTVAAWSALFALYPALVIWYGSEEAKARGGKPVLSSKPTEHVCDKCGKPMVLREGSRGPFLGCTGYPKCLNIKDVDAAGNPVKPIETGLRPVSGWYYGAAGFFAGFTACNELPAASFVAALGLLLLWQAPRRTLFLFVPPLLLPVGGFLTTNYLAIGRLTPAYGEVGGPWYEYPGSYWEETSGKVKYGIDWAREHESRGTYAFHFLLGHHGFFSLTPVFLVAAGGLLYGWLRRRKLPEPGPRLTLVIGLTLVLTVVVVGFYVLVVSARNYGGWTNGPRWLIWLTPFWLLSLLPVADGLSERRLGRWLAYAALALSVLSVNYKDWTPWRHPWIYDFLESRGWLPY